VFGAGPWRLLLFDETTHWPGRAVPSAGTIKQPRITEITENTLNVTGPSARSQPRRVSLSPDSESIYEQIGACQNNIQREVVSV